MLTNHEINQSETFLDTYVSEIEPKFEKIDLLLKTSEEPISVYIAAEMLDLTPEEVTDILRQLRVDIITPAIFISIMEQGDSNLCQLFQREVKIGSPHTYTAQNISYIYNIDIELVKASFQSIKATEVTASVLPLIFSQIPVI